MLRRFTAILLALQVLISSTGYSITAHLCHGKAMSYSLFGNPAGCCNGEKREADKHCEQTEPSDISGNCLQQQQCCINQSQHFKGIETVIQITRQVINVSDFVFPSIGQLPVFESDLFASVVKPSLADYNPPDWPRDLPVLLRVFRI